MQVEEVGEYVLDSLAAAMLLRPRLPARAVPLVLLLHFRVIGQLMLNLRRLLVFWQLCFEVGQEGGGQERWKLWRRLLERLLVDPGKGECGRCWRLLILLLLDL